MVCTCKMRFVLILFLFIGSVSADTCTHYVSCGTCISKRRCIYTKATGNLFSCVEKKNLASIDPIAVYKTKSRCTRIKQGTTTTTTSTAVPLVLTTPLSFENVVQHEIPQKSFIVTKDHKNHDHFNGYGLTSMTIKTTPPPASDNLVTSTESLQLQRSVTPLPTLTTQLELLEKYESTTPKMEVHPFVDHGVERATEFYPPVSISMEPTTLKTTPLTTSIPDVFWITTTSPPLFANVSGLEQSAVQSTTSQPLAFLTSSTPGQTKPGEQTNNKTREPWMRSGIDYVLLKQEIVQASCLLETLFRQFGELRFLQIEDILPHKWIKMAISNPVAIKYKTMCYQTKE